MNSMFMLFIVFAVFIILRIVNEKALSKLSSDQKVLLLDGFSKMRIYNLIPLVVIIALYFYLLKNSSFNGHLIKAFYYLSLIAYLGVLIILVQKKLRSLNLPNSYIKTYSIVQALQIVALIFLFFVALS